MADGPGIIHLAPGVRVARTALTIATSRSGGPGGQHVNTTESRVQITVAVTAIEGLRATAQMRLRALAGQSLDADDRLHLVCDRHRSQAANRAEVLERLSELVAAAIPEPVIRRKTKPGKAAARRRLDGKKRTSDRKAGRGPVGED